ncbi:DUF1428 domain-containing protein [Asticcacaulis sp. AC402]|uniref:DUF1428 domain-containing protein n=1 Tax=Asticcacaulis sp. AC402 TaxID=1282361 RepID=UPI0003C3D740|nr:DUF1428 domain-containing protein [Asticcacaulis sp. AC402]ESQ74918.1 hypothetical protein ABAC402_12245 [Asticcacaulis sp. AC402]
MSYIDGFLLAVPNGNKEKYIESSKAFATYVKTHGALSVHEYWGDDVPDGKLTSFPMAVKLEPGETVVFSWIEWPDKATRDAGNKKMMEDPEMANMEMPFDGKRMMYGGFAKLIED